MPLGQSSAFKAIYVYLLLIGAFSTLTLLVGCQEGHPACKKTEWCSSGMVVCLERGADLHTAQLMSHGTCNSRNMLAGRQTDTGTVVTILYFAVMGRVIIKLLCHNQNKFRLWRSNFVIVWFQPDEIFFARLNAAGCDVKHFFILIKCETSVQQNSNSERPVVCRCIYVNVASSSCRQAFLQIVYGFSSSQSNLPHCCGNSRAV